ncbi:hypothetical protein AQUCO_00100773v1 [Aquilegia coerulea]|uniref:Uncharacterized protein n=1 Tax=Aquilegia coerulea TaxID=218851 RepID=A0A2G5FC09_AQUCA|nr:hypothetical protein AQUCO_00100773v1 [Aquilegia coerulea]
MEEEEGFCKKENKEPWRVLEFYSGIGGMRYSIIRAGIEATMVEAFDINDKANDVYQHNFRHRPYQGNIQNLTGAELDNYKAHAWLLSPPCQPYTRQGLQKDSGDARASSFLKILDLIPEMSMPPYMLFVENVVGFETSDTHKQMIEILVSTGFITQEYILTPLQFGVPYSRPRYFCLAKRKPSAFKNPHVNNQLLWTPSPFFENGGNALMTDHDESHERWKEWLQFCKPIESFLEFRTSYQPMNAECNISAFGCETLDERDEGIASSSSCPEEYVVPLSLIERWGSAMDIVYPDSKRCCCFTKSYFRHRGKIKCLC